MFRVLDSVDSTNNYAMGMVQDGMANDGDAWFAMDQFAGKGQQGKIWKSRPGANITMSLAIGPASFFDNHRPLFNMLTASITANFLSEVLEQKIFVKWPNDLYWNDRKAGGILIENRFSGTEWKWAVIGIGINVNQTSFPASLPNPVSLCQIRPRNWKPIELAKSLHRKLMEGLKAEQSVNKILEEYNAVLYKKGQKARLKLDNASFISTIDGVDVNGNLLTHDVMERVFEYGSVEWLISPHSIIF
jgi:BirA family biotin operon repressor/biotin-[acetyl-CoA-carboxylase] ligase